MPGQEDIRLKGDLGGIKLVRLPLDWENDWY